METESYDTYHIMDVILSFKEICFRTRVVLFCFCFAFFGVLSFGVFEFCVVHLDFPFSQLPHLHESLDLLVKVEAMEDLFCCLEDLVNIVDLVWIAFERKVDQRHLE